MTTLEILKGAKAAKAAMQSLDDAKINEALVAMAGAVVVTKKVR